MEPGRAAGPVAQMLERLLDTRRALGWIPSATGKEWFLRRRQKDEELEEGHSWLQMLFEGS